MNYTLSGGVFEASGHGQIDVSKHNMIYIRRKVMEVVQCYIIWGIQ